MYLYIYTDEEQIDRQVPLTKDDYGPFDGSDSEIKNFLYKIEYMTIFFKLRQYINPLSIAIQSCYE